MSTVKMDPEKFKRAKEYEKHELGGSFAQWRTDVYGLEVSHECNFGSAGSRVYPGRKAIIWSVPFKKKHLPPTDWDLPIEYVVAYKMRHDRLTVEQAMQKVSCERKIEICR